MAEFNLNPVMNPDVAKELTQRMSDVENRDKNWMYKKYAYIKMSTTGESQTAMCPSVYSIGDGTIGHGGHLSLYTEEGGIRKFKPTLTSVKMNNDGGQDYTEAYIYEIEAQFKVFTLDDLDKVEASFFRIGAEVKFEFGWYGIRTVSGINQIEGDDAIKANVYNFSFSLEDDGGFACTIKAMSAAALWPQETLEGTDKPSPEEEATKKNARICGFLEKLQLAHRAAFSIPEGKSLDFVEGGINDNQLKWSTHTFKAGNTTINGSFWVTEMLTNQGSWYNDDEKWFSYTNLATLINYINAKLSKGDSQIRYKIPTGTKEAKMTTNAYWKNIGSADPTQIVLQGERASYGSGGSEDTDNFKAWKSRTLESSLLNSSAQGEHDIGGILIGIEYMTKLYFEMEDATSSKRGGVKQKPKIKDFLQKIFNKIETLSGGMVSLMTTPEIINQGEQETKTNNILILNRRETIETFEADPFEFETLSKRAICKSVSLETDFDSDTLILSTQNAIASGQSNYDALIKLYPNCEGLKKAIKAAKDKAAGDDGISDEDIRKKRASYGDDGIDMAGLAAMADANKEYIQQKRITNPKAWPAQFSEQIFMFKLNLTLDGIFGIPYLSPITIDRLPNRYKASNKTYFSVTSIEHSFDGQGGWDTSLDTVMRIQGK